ncbi:MAG: N-acetyl sugar amidotransferase [Alphaproteobacteria bacterium]|nr:N-acetyl sugar amidotransferase [Alphaproteobacteria bacterium]
MDYCKRCVYPENSKPGIIFDDEGICSGCRSFERKTISIDNADWDSRERKFKEILFDHRDTQRRKQNPYDCIIPVSGGKDSTWQVYVIREKYKLNPLLVTYNHTFNTPLGIRNLTNLVSRLDCNLIRYTTAPGSAKRIAKYMLKTVGDVTWHYHAGIMTFPITAAIQYDVPLILWGEEGFSELVGMHNLDDYVEFTKKKRQEHSMRGFEPEDLLQRENCELTRYDLAPFFYPTDQQLENVGVRGIYMANYIRWDGRKQAEFVIDNFGFETGRDRERTFNTYAKLEDIHANGLHDWLKYLKFGYGRATDDASNEIRHGRMSRNDGIEMVKKYDHVRPSDVDVFLDAVDMTEPELMAMIESMRDPQIWRKDKFGEWKTIDNVANHINDDGVDHARIPLIENERKPFRTTPENISPHTQTGTRQKEYVIL